MPNGAIFAYDINFDLIWYGFSALICFLRKTESACDLGV